MGIVIEVQSIFPILTTDTSVTHYQIQKAQSYIEEICKAFRWKKLPWHEVRAPEGAFSYSFSYSLYALALKVAEGSFPRKYQEFANLPFSALSKAERFEWFRHFLDRDEYANFYLPIDFDPPKHLENKFSQNSFAVASALKLIKEMQDLQQELLYYVQQYGEQTKVKEGLYTWGDIYNFSVRLESACREGMELSLPVQLLW